MSPVARDARTALAEVFTNERLEKDKASLYVCTVVSMIPVALHEEKPHIFPGVFDIESAEKDDITVFHIGEGHHFIPDAFDEKRNYRQITPPHEMARSICDDYNTAHIGTDSESGPGLFYVVGRFSRAEVKEKFKSELEHYRARQNRWFDNLVALADADWEKNHNRLAVSDLQRVAARYKGYQADWVEVKQQDNKACPYCKAMIASDSIKCFNCKEVVDSVRYAMLQGGIKTKE